MTSNAHMMHNRTGFTLPEAMLAMVILSMAAAGVLVPFAGGAAVQADGMHRSLGAALAGDLLERVVQTPFDQIISTWHGYTEPEGQLKDASGTTFTDPMYANYSREAFCYSVYVPQQSGMVDPDFVLTAVRVSYRGTQIATVYRLISK
jgi:prepilin-type N-terminal cleavage/methylation domain-containing protein